MRMLLVSALMIVSLGTWGIAQDKGETGVILGPEFRPVSEGQGTLRINSYGNTPVKGSREGPGFQIVADSFISEFGNYLSINNGAIEKIGDDSRSWSVITHLNSPDGSSTGIGISAVKKVGPQGDILRIDFTHQVLDPRLDSQPGLCYWLVSIVFTNLTGDDLKVCYFPYIDYDLYHNNPDDPTNTDSATYDRTDSAFGGVPAIRVNSQRDDGVFAFADLEKTSSKWRIRNWSPENDPLRRGPNCISLENGISPFRPADGDFTAAFKYSLRIPARGRAVVNLQMGRFQ